MYTFSHSSIYGIEIYSFSTGEKNYQLTFDRESSDPDDRCNVHLMDIFAGEETAIDYKIRDTVCQCFIDYFSKFPHMEVFYEIEITHKRNLAKLIKFIRWSQMHQKFVHKVDITKIDDKLYAEIYIKS